MSQHFMWTIEDCFLWRFSFPVTIIQSCVCVGLLPCMSLLLILRFYGCVFTWLHLGLVVKYNSDSILFHKNKISVMLYHSLKGETRGYNRKHMWMVMVHGIRVHWIAIRPVHINTLTLVHVLYAGRGSRCKSASYYLITNLVLMLIIFLPRVLALTQKTKMRGEIIDKKNNGWLLSIFLFSALYIYSY